MRDICCTVAAGTSGTPAAPAAAICCDTSLPVRLGPAEALLPAALPACRGERRTACCAGGETAEPGADAADCCCSAAVRALAAEEAAGAGSATMSLARQEATILMTLRWACSAAAACMAAARLACAEAAAASACAAPAAVASAVMEMTLDAGETPLRSALPSSSSLRGQGRWGWERIRAL